MVTKAKPRRGTKVPTTKMCTCCHQVRNISDFYSNRDWVEQLGKDVWCKTCAAKAKTKDELRKYFWENNREWSDKLWDNSYKKAQQEASTNDVYMKTTDERRANILNQLTVQKVLKGMNLSYKFVDNSQNVNVNSYEEAKESGLIAESNEEDDPNIKTYSKEFNGDFTKRQIDYLHEFYAGLDKDFDLDSDYSLADNAKKVAKAAMTLDKTQNDFLMQKCTAQDLTNAINAYNSLMSLGNFAASKRKPGDKAGLNNWAETTMYCETHGHPCIKKVEWDKDSVDEVLERFAYIITSLRSEEEG